MYKADSKTLAAHRANLLGIALQMAEADHYTRVTRDGLAKAGGVANGIVTATFGTMTQFRRDLMRHAVNAGNLRVIGQGLAQGCPHAAKAPAEVRQAAMQALAS